MNYALRVLLRLVTLVLALSIVVVVLAGSFWYVWQDAKGRAPGVGYTVTVKKVEHAALDVYLRFRGSAAIQSVRSNDAQEVTFVINSGETVSKVAENLQARGLISDAQLFGWVVRYLGNENDIQAGLYVLRPNMGMEEIVRQFQHGRVAATQVTIPEGWRAEEIAALLEQVGVTPAADFLAAVAEGRTDYAFLGDRPAGSPASLEGFLFPDTYQFPLKTSPGRVLEIMLQNFDRRVPSDLRRKAALQDLTLYEALKLASIIEREAMVTEERPIIAGVYLNRINKGMYLQADATVQYAKGLNPAKGRWWNPTTVEESQKIVSPYNTYLHPGLPPGPICNPGLAAITAALEPTSSDYLYYYAKGDGSHAFSATYEEQLRNQELYGGKSK